jgi:hypothetical protein
VSTCGTAVAYSAPASLSTGRLGVVWTCRRYLRAVALSFGVMFLPCRWLAAIFIRRWNGERGSAVGVDLPTGKPEEGGSAGPEGRK